MTKPEPEKGSGIAFARFTKFATAIARVPRDETLPPIKPRPKKAKPIALTKRKRKSA